MAMAERFWSLPLPRQSVHFVDSTESEGFQSLLLALEQAEMIGLDAEWKPVKAAGERTKVAILQVACRRSSSAAERSDSVYIVDVLMMPGSRLLVEPLRRALQSGRILKLGFRLRQDLVNLTATFAAEGDHVSFGKIWPYVDIGKLHRQLRGARHGRRLNNDITGLSSICEEVVGSPLCKDLQCSDWEQRPLTQQQLDYAAADAYCLLAIADALYSDLQNVYIALKDKAVGIGGILHPTPISPSSIITRFGSTTWTGPGYMSLAGETLLVDAACSKNGRKPRNRRPHEVEIQEGRHITAWTGPAPWNPSIGGDGYPKFLCDIMIEGLARQLRCVGIDAACPHGLKPDARQLVEQTVKEGRVLLTRDLKLLKQRLVPPNQAYLVRNLNKKDQLAEIIETFKLEISEDQLLSRCTKCNGQLVPEPLTAQQAKAAAPKQEIPEEVMSQEGLLFWQCSVCKHLYWQGLQFRRALEQFMICCNSAD